MSVAIFFPSEDYTLAWIGEVTGCLTLDLELVLSKIIAYPRMWNEEMWWVLIL